MLFVSGYLVLQGISVDDASVPYLIVHTISTSVQYIIIQADLPLLEVCLTLLRNINITQHNILQHN